MKHLTHWILALVVLSAGAGLSGAGAWTGQQKQAEKKERKLGPTSDGKKPRVRDPAARYDAVKKALPTLQVTLTESIQLAEKESGGKAFSANIEVVANRPSITVKLFVGDRLTTASVDPLSKKVSLPHPKKEEVKEGTKEGAGEEKGG